MEKSAIWQRTPDLSDINRMGQRTMVAHLGIEVTEVGERHMKATMPVDERTLQPYGILHGGASVALAETLGSIAAMHCIDAERQTCVGLDINANHIRKMERGAVTGTVTPVHLGGSTQVWQILISDESGRLVCISRITMAVLSRRNAPASPAASGASDS